MRLSFQAIHWRKAKVEFLYEREGVIGTLRIKYSSAFNAVSITPCPVSDNNGTITKLCSMVVEVVKGDYDRAGLMFAELWTASDINRAATLVKEGEEWYLTCPEFPQPILVARNV